MRSTFHGLETARRGLFSQQTAINTTGHNISNANTKGYSRQIVNFTASNAIEVPGINHSTIPGQLGTGVEFTDINRIRESFLDDQFRNQNQSYGDWSVQTDTLEKIETIINEPSEQGIRAAFDKFWNSWQELTNQPDNLTARSVVMENSVALTETINDVASNLTQLKSDLLDSIKLKVDSVNTLTKEIGELNQQIARIESIGDNANDLRDKRDLVTDELSKLININVVKTDRGYNISTGGTQLVTLFQATPLDANSLPPDISGGELKGYLASVENVDDFKAEVDQLVKGLVQGEFEITLPAGTILPDGTTLTRSDNSQITFSGGIAARTLTADTKVKINGINGLHQLGYTLQDPAKAGGTIFNTIDGTNNFVAGNIKVNPDIISDVRNIAASAKVYNATTATGTVEKVIKGNNDLALWIAQLKNTTITFDQQVGAVSGEGTIDEAFRSIVGRIGVRTQEAQRLTDNHKLLVEQVDSRRQSISGVSLDEEMSNLIKFQHAYNASARMITAIDEILNKIINGMGVVGR